MINSIATLKRTVYKILTDSLLCRIMGTLIILFNFLITYEDVYMLYQYNFCKGCYWYAMEYESILYFRIVIGAIGILLGAALISLKIRYWLIVLIVYALIFNARFEGEMRIYRIEAEADRAQNDQIS